LDDPRSTDSFIVKDAIGQMLGYFYFEDEPGRRSSGQAADPRRGPMDGGETSGKLPELLPRKDDRP
jgi:hypothetical protein